MRNDNHDEHYHPSRRETLATLIASGLTLALLLAVGYAVPDLLNNLVH
ncbi:hypothetical protein HFV04_017000 [Pseudomonas sp. BIGb0427]|nr:hypothetical protein [Pseudomonas sp. BIGb0427]NLU60045.1 hypothetical protein [Pseudomonas sp. BIGb0427]QPG61218.1 hypothetical protein HFV04_017000 [Pseudomonas sp. BIGb0427]